MSEFHRLVEGQIPRLRRYARALTRDAVRADDLVQDTLERGIAKAHLWQADTDIRVWLFTIMHNQYVNTSGGRTANLQLSMSIRWRLRSSQPLIPQPRGG